MRAGLYACLVLIISQTVSILEPEGLILYIYELLTLTYIHIILYIQDTSYIQDTGYRIRYRGGRELAKQCNAHTLLELAYKLLINACYIAGWARINVTLLH